MKHNVVIKKQNVGKLYVMTETLKKIASTLPRVAADEVCLTRTKGTLLRGGGKGGEAWRVDVDGKRAGVVFINFINVLNEPPLGDHPSLQIHLNAKSQGRGIGRIALQQACQASRYDVIYAYMSKANLPSRRAAAAAGFVNDTPQGYRQVRMVWRRQK